MDTPKTDFKKQAASFLKENGTLAALIILAIIFGFLDDSFLTPRNLTNLIRQTTIIAIISVGMTMVIIICGIDLSVGSIVGLSAIMVTLLMQHGIGVWLAILITLLVSGVFIGLWPAFIPFGRATPTPWRSKPAPWTTSATFAKRWKAPIPSRRYRAGAAC